MAQKWLKIAKIAQKLPKMAQKLAPAKKKIAEIYLPYLPLFASLVLWIVCLNDWKPKVCLFPPLPVPSPSSPILCTAQTEGWTADRRRSASSKLPQPTSSKCPHTAVHTALFSVFTVSPKIASHCMASTTLHCLVKVMDPSQCSSSMLCWIMRRYIL